MDDISLEDLQAALQTVQERKSTVVFFLESDHARDQTRKEKLSKLHKLYPEQCATQAKLAPHPPADEAER